MPKKWIDPNATTLVQSSVHVRRVSHGKARALLRGAWTKWIEPEVITDSAFICACEQGDQLKNDIALLQEIPKKWLEPEVTSYNAVVSECEKGEPWAGSWVAAGDPEGEVGAGSDRLQSSHQYMRCRRSGLIRMRPP